MRARPAWLLILTAAASGAAGVPYLTEPALCPTRPEIAFVSGGGIWVVSSHGGMARPLVSHSADESRPLYSPDGNRLAFLSTRTGGGDIYVLTIASGALKRLTFDNFRSQLDAWSRDGRWIYFSSGRREIGARNDVYRISAEGGTPMSVSADRFVNEFQAAPAPDGSSVAFVARSIADRQWWRLGHSHIDESEIWIRRDGSPAQYERLVDRKGRNLWPNWSPDGRTLYFASDRGGAQNLWMLTPPGGSPRALTHFTGGRVLWPSISYDGRAIVFEHDFGIWKLDVGAATASPVRITLPGVSKPDITRLTLRNFSELALSPDGNRLALIAHGEIFSAPVRSPDRVVRITETPMPESEVEWAPDSNRMVYVSERGAIAHIYLYDFARALETQLTRGPAPDLAPHFSPDGRSVSFVRDYRELRVVSLATQQDRLIASAPLRYGASAWSPDGRWLAYMASGEGGLRNVYLAPVAGGPGRQVSFLPNTGGSHVGWGPNGRFLFFETRQRTEASHVARVLLASSANAGISFDGIRGRTSLLRIGLTATNPRISPDGRRLVVTSTLAGQQNLYVYALNGAGSGDGVAKQLTATKGSKSYAQFSPDSRLIYYLEGGRLRTIPAAGGDSRELAVTARIEVDFAQEKMAVFEQAWSALRDWFYDPKMHGVDWTAVRHLYTPLVQAARTRDELVRLLRLMVGELNASHCGVNPPAGERRPATAQLGVAFDRALYERSGVMKVTTVMAGSPAAAARIPAGAELRAVDGVATGAHVNLDQFLQNKAGKKVVLNVNGRQVTVEPAASLGALRYRRWVEQNRDYVLRASGGKLGYVHVRDMQTEALDRFYLDLDASNRAKAGVVIDIRDNTGGFVNAYAIDVLARRGYLKETPRGDMTASGRTSSGQRSLEKPTILVVNQQTLSDGEDFTEGYRTLKLGKVVGEPTAGWVIGTSNKRLIDGIEVRLPRILISGADGKTLENNPRPVDIPVSRPIGETYTGRDSQLDAAVRELLRQLGLTSPDGPVK